MQADAQMDVDTNGEPSATLQDLLQLELTSLASSENVRRKGRGFNSNSGKCS